MNKSFILDFDPEPKAVLNPDYEKKDYHFPKKLLYAFIPPKSLRNFLKKYRHKVIGQFLSVSFSPKIYEVEIKNEKFTLCRASLGAPAATQLLDWLIAYGVKQILAIGSAGVLTDIPENYFLIPTKAIRDEGTSFHYFPSSNFVDLKSSYLQEIENQMVEMHFKVKEVMTWSTDGFFRETPAKVAQFKKLGASTVEMECSAMAACAQFRHINFAQILFTADSLNDLNVHDDRGWGNNSHIRVMDLAANILINLTDK